MRAIYKKELSSFFRSMTGYVLIAFMVTFIGIYFMIYNLNQGYPYFSYTLSVVMLLLLILIPVLLCIGIAAWLSHVTKNYFLGGILAFLTIAAAMVFLIIDSSRYEGLFQELLAAMNVSEAFNQAAFNNIFDIAGTVLQITIIGVFLFLTMQSIEKRRWS